MFDFKRFLDDHWKDTSALLTFLETYGFQVDRQALFKWKVRGSIPGNWFAVLLALLEIDAGRPLSISKYLKSST